MIKIAIVDDKPANRNILEHKIIRNSSFTVMMKAANGEDFLEKMKQSDELPDVVLMDIEMPVMDGIAAIACASSLYPAVKFVVLTVFDDDDSIYNAIRAGACGYLLKEEAGNTIADMLLNLWENGAGPISPSIAYKILQMLQQQGSKIEVNSTPDANIFQLSDREKEILTLLSQGLEYKEIAARINISPNTVKKHTVNIYQKLHVDSKAKALRIAYMKGLIE